MSKKSLTAEQKAYLSKAGLTEPPTKDQFEAYYLYQQALPQEQRDDFVPCRVDPLVDTTLRSRKTIQPNLQPVVPPPPVVEDPKPWREVSIEALNISAKARQVLGDNNLKTAGAIYDWTSVKPEEDGEPNRLMDLDGIGQSTEDSIVEAIKGLPGFDS